MNSIYVLILLALPFCTAESGEERSATKEQLSKYKELQDAIQEFIDGVWQTLTDTMHNDPRLAYNEDLMQAFNVMLSPMLVSANGSRTHADAMSAFCYNYFEVGLLMTDDHIKQPIFSTGESKIINEFQACQSRMKQLQSKCLTTLGVNLIGGVWGRMISMIHGLIPGF